MTLSIDERIECLWFRAFGITYDEWKEEEHKRDKSGRFTKGSQSAMKSVKANIARGRNAMNIAITEKRTVHRAMYHNSLGWVDFEWGDDGLTKPFNKKGEPVGKGISHIIEARMRKDGMSYEDVTRMLTQNIVDTIAKGKVYKEATLPNGKVKNIQLDYNGHRAVLIKKQGNNGWILTAFELHPTDVNSAGGVDTERTTNTKTTLTRQGDGAVGLKSNDGQRVGFDTTEPTHFKPTRTRQGMGAFDGFIIDPSSCLFQQLERKTMTSIEQRLARLEARIYHRGIK